MRDNSTMSLPEFLGNCIFYGLITMVSYQKILLRCLPDITYALSKTILWGMLAASVIIGALLVFRYQRTGPAVASSILLPYGLYTVMAYAETARAFIACVLAAAAVSAVLHTAHAMNAITRRAHHSSNVRINRLYQCCCAGVNFTAAAMAIIILCLGAGRAFGVGDLSPSVGAVGSDGEPAQTISRNIHTVLLLQEDKWSGLTVLERLDVMQTVANIEAHYLGLPNELNVIASDLDDNVLGCYSDDTYTIFIDREHLEGCPAHEILNACCHEAYHSYQFRLVDAFNGADESLKGLRIFRPAVAYSQEFGNYISSYEDREAYYRQNCETDCREYAESAVEDYYRRIVDYLDGQAADG